MGDEILTIQEVADYLKLNEKTAYRLAYRVLRLAAVGALREQI